MVYLGPFGTPQVSSAEKGHQLTIASVSVTTPSKG